MLANLFEVIVATLEKIKAETLNSPDRLFIAVTADDSDLLGNCFQVDLAFAFCHKKHFICFEYSCLTKKSLFHRIHEFGFDT